MGNDDLSEEVAIWRISSITRRLWIDYWVFLTQMELYKWARNEVELRLLECGWNAREFGLYKGLLEAQWFFTVHQTKLFQFLIYMSPNTNTLLSPSKKPNSIELLAMDFDAKMKMPYTDPPMIASSEKMKSKYVGYNKMTLFGCVLDGRLNLTTIKSALEKAWYLFKIEDMVFYKGEIFQIRMESQEQVAALMLGKPWIVAQHIFQIIPWMKFYETKELNFSKFYVWMHLNNYPNVYLDKEIIEGNLVKSGYFDMSNLKFLEIYPKTETQPSCVRVKVLLDVHDPIPPGFLLLESINGVDWISFVFENLPVFCFKCGFIGHHFAACNVTEEGHGNEVRVSLGGQRFQFYSSKTRVVPKSIGDRFVFGFSLLFGTYLNQPLLPLITNVGDSSVNSKRMNTNAEPTKRPMIIDISSPQLHAIVGPSNDHECQTAQDQLPLTVEAHNPGQMGFSTQIAFQNFHPLHELECPPGFAQLSSDPKNLHFIDLSQLQEHIVQEEGYSFKRQEISQGVAAKELMKQDKEKFNEMVESFFAEDREARRKTPVHDDHEVVAVHPNILQKTSAGKGKKTSLG